MKNMMLKRLSLAFAASTALAAVPASALTINLIDTGGVAGTQAELGFRIAADFWGRILTNNVTVNLEVGFANMGNPNVLGSTGSSIMETKIGTYYGALAANQATALDAIAVANLQPLVGGGVDVIVPGYWPDAGAGQDIDPFSTRFSTGTDVLNTDMALLTANAKALGLYASNDPDASITFNSIFSWDFDPTDGVGLGTYDFIGVAVHEIGHALGFVSGVDDFDYFANFNDIPVDDWWWGYGLDLFRYSANPEGYGDGGPQLDWSIGSDAFFSIDGENPLWDAYFSTGTNYGDGWQASHWKANNSCSNFLGIMNPYACDGEVDEVTARDLALFDAIGWNLDFDVLSRPGMTISSADMYKSYFGAVPEPTTWMMMIGGFAFIGASMRRRQKVSVRFA
jgi:hypothetical protein